MSLQPETLAIRIQADRSAHQEHAVPLYLSSSFVFNDAEQMRLRFAEEEPANLYSRFSNPNTSELIQKICTLEGGENGWATATGMSAVFTTFAALLQSGDHVVSCRSIFGSTHQLFTQVFPKWGINTTYVDAQASAAEWSEVITKNTKVLYVETPTNPSVHIIDLRMLASIAKAHDLLLVVDNCFATPVIQQPLQLGADVVIHSATKYIDGQGRVLGGLIVADEAIIEQVKFFARHSGPAMSPFNAWVLSKSMETLTIRMEKHTNNATFLAESLSNHPAVATVRYPFLPSHPQVTVAKAQMRLGGGILAFEHKNGLAGGQQFLNKLQLFSLTANLGDSRSIATHPASTTHAKLSTEERLNAGITDGLIRISAGLEADIDLLNDVLQALDE